MHGKAARTRVASALEEVRLDERIILNDDCKKVFSLGIVRRDDRGEVAVTGREWCRARGGKVGERALRRSGGTERGANIRGRVIAA